MSSPTAASYTDSTELARFQKPSKIAAAVHDLMATFRHDDHGPIPPCRHCPDSDAAVRLVTTTNPNRHTGWRSCGQQVYLVSQNGPVHGRLSLILLVV